MREDEIEIVENTTVHDGWTRLSVVVVRLADGRTVSREVVERSDAACVLPFDAERRTALLVRQLRVPVYLADRRDSLLEAIAGMLDGGEAADTTRREAMEEAGLRLGELDFVANAWTSPGTMTERIALYLAPYQARDRVGAGGGLAEEHEDIEVVEMPLDRLAAEVDAGAIADMKTLVLIQSLRLRHPALFSPGTAP
jgi:nudix-type nucleoside diphosphatase (YffH/AdpP family)